MQLGGITVTPCSKGPWQATSWLHSQGQTCTCPPQTFAGSAQANYGLVVQVRHANGSPQVLRQSCCHRCPCLLSLCILSLLSLRVLKVGRLLLVGRREAAAGVVSTSTRGAATAALAAAAKGDAARGTAPEQDAKRDYNCREAGFFHVAKTRVYLPNFLFPK